MIRRAIGIALATVVLVVPNAGAAVWHGGGSPPGLSFDAEAFGLDGSFLGLGTASGFGFYGLQFSSGVRIAYTAPAITGPLAERPVAGLPLGAAIVSLWRGGAGFRLLLDDGGIYASDVHGAAWSYVGSLGLFQGDMAAWAIDPRDPAHAVRVYTDGGVQRSTDGGLTWYSAYPLELPDSANAGAAAFRSDGSIVVAVGEKLWSSSDLGTTWTDLPDRPAPATIVAGAGGVLWSSDGAGLYRSDDGGAGWHRVAAAADDVVPSPDEPDVAWAIRPGEVAFTVDGGATWHRVAGARQPGPFGLLNTSYVPVPGGGRQICVFVAQGAWCSADGRAFASADRLLAGTTAGIGSVAPDPRVSGRAVGLSGGRLWETVDGAVSWHPSAAPSDPYYLSVKVTRRDDVLAGFGGVRARRHGTAAWRALGGPAALAFNVAADPATGTLYAVVGGRLWRARPGGSFRVTGARGLPLAGVDAIEIGGDGGSIAVTTGPGWWLSTDDGGTFHALRGPAKRFAVTVAPHDRFRLVAATIDGTFTSGDSGLHWWRVARRYAPSVIADPWARGRWLAIGNGVLTVSVDDGRSWHRLPGSPATSTSPSCCMLAVSPGRLWESSPDGPLGIGLAHGVWWRALPRS
jgi:hypothetical protein